MKVIAINLPKKHAISVIDAASIIANALHPNDIENATRGILNGILAAAFEGKLKVRIPSSLEVLEPSLTIVQPYDFAAVGVILTKDFADYAKEKGISIFEDIHAPPNQQKAFTAHDDKTSTERNLKASDDFQNPTLFKQKAKADSESAQLKGTCFATEEPEKPWLKKNSGDPEPDQPWYVPARYFARQLVISDSGLLLKKLILADKVSKSMAAVGVFKRGGKKPLAADTVLKAFVNVVLS